MGDFSLSVNPVPLNGGVLIRIIGSSKQSPGGIIIPDNVKNMPIQGVVEAVSQGYVREGLFMPHEVHIGDVVIFNWKAGTDLFLDDVNGKSIEFRMVHEKDIVAILKGVYYGEE
jgi:chaperonin GroES